MNIVDEERAKYEAIWAIPDYRRYSPGLNNVGRFMSTAKPEAGSSLIDIGAGACVAGLELAHRGLDVWFLDITSAVRHPSIQNSRFIECPLWTDWGDGRKWDYGFCCDVLEHIPTEYVMLCVDKILTRCKTSWLQIALRPDQFGAKIGKSLHLTVRSHAWWLGRLSSVCRVKEAHDLQGVGLYVIER